MIRSRLAKPYLRARTYYSGHTLLFTHSYPLSDSVIYSTIHSNHCCTPFVTQDTNGICFSAISSL